MTPTIEYPTKPRARYSLVEAYAIAAAAGLLGGIFISAVLG